MSISGGIFVLQQIYNKSISGTWPKDLFRINSIVNNLSVINEGDSLIITVNTKDAENETLYWTLQSVTGTINTSDFSSISGSFVVQSNNYGYFTLTSLQDVTTEGTESFYVQIRRNSITGPIAINSGIITINDTSVAPNYSLSANTSSLTEGNTVRFTVNTSNIANNTTLYFNTTQVSGTINANDFIDDSLSGSFIINDNVGSFDRTLKNDTTTEISESFQITVRTDNIDGPIVVTSNTITVIDTSYVALYGWFGGGKVAASTSASRVDRITFSSDTVVASARGNLSAARYALAAVGNKTSGWFGGGYAPGLRSIINRVTYSTDTAVAAARGPLSVAIFGLGGTDNSNDFGWFAGGSPGSGTITRMYRITFSNDASATTSRGTLSLGRYQLTGIVNNGNFAWFAGGTAIPGGATSLIDRLEFANDNTTASIRGPLIAARYFQAGVANYTYGWFGGGNGPVSTITRITFASDTVASTNISFLFTARRGLSGVDNNNFGWFGGGATGTTSFSIVDRLTFASDTTTASSRGNLNQIRSELASVSGIA